MAERPTTALLSDVIKSSVGGRRLLSAVFLTFRFESQFFEQQVLPLFFDVALSHADTIKRVQMEQELQNVQHGVAVYYDQNGLTVGGGSAHLDVRRIAVRHATGIFHPKNVFALVEDVEPDENGHRERALIMASMSANLTRAGWWENVEVCHVEELKDGDFTRLRDDVLRFLEGLERRVFDKAADAHAALKAIKAFLRSTEQRQTRSTSQWLHTHFFGGGEPVCDFLSRVAGGSLDGLNLEIISPYFDAGPESAPLDAMIKQFSPREVRVFLPKNDAGEALCTNDLFNWLRSQPTVGWGKLPKDLTRGGKAENAKARMVHAKVYRFFSANPKREYLFIGSVNLTGPAHRRGGNMETGFLVELDPPRRPDWWMECDGSRPSVFKPRGEDEGAVNTSGSRLSLRYWWDSKTAQAYWDDVASSRLLQVSWSGGELFAIEPLASRVWTTLSEDAAKALGQVLRSTSILSVSGDRAAPVPVLVQEEGMKSKPSALFDLTPAEILQYWSLLTSQQRTAFLEVHAPDIAISSADEALVSKFTPLAKTDAFFDRFAGIFISFGSLERSIRESLDAGNTRAAEYRLFGQKYDSLGRLLERLDEDASKGVGDIVEQYVMALCARQTVTELRNAYGDFFREHPDDLDRLLHLLRVADSLRKRLLDTDTDLTTFLPWFEAWFLRRAEPVNQEPES